jgi:hypothetical protein
MDVLCADKTGTLTMKHHGVDAVEVLVVFVAYFDIGGQCRRRHRRGYGGIGKIQLVHRLQVAANGLRPERHRAVYRRRDPYRPAALDVPAETGWDFDPGLHVAAASISVEGLH